MRAMGGGGEGDGACGGAAVWELFVFFSLSLARVVLLP